MRSLHLDTGRDWRGGQRQCSLLCRGLARRGDEVHLCCRPDSPLGEVAEGAILHPWEPRGEIDLVAVARLRRLMGRLSPDIVAAHDAHAAGLLALAGGRAGRVFHRRVDVPLRTHPAARWKAHRADLWICVSRRIEDILRRGRIDRTRVVHSGVPPMRPRPGLRGELGLGETVKVVGAIGGLIPHKGHRVLIEAMAALTDSETHLLLIGDGPMRGELSNMLSEMGLQRRAHLLGERRDLPALFGTLDLYAHPSLTEGLGTSILDAFSAGVPVVATRAGGIPEMVADGRTGRLVEPGDAGALARAIGDLLRGPEAARALASAARACYEAEFTDDRMVEKTRRCYQELVPNAGGGSDDSPRRSRPTQRSASRVGSGNR